MTKSLQAEISSLNLNSRYKIKYYTGPSNHSPVSINNQDDAKKSSIACIQDFDKNFPNIYKDFDGYLIACYSDHPLINELKIRINRPNVVIMGIFQASMLYAMNYASEKCKSAILTSGNDWEPLLDNAIIKFCSCSNDGFPLKKFSHTLASNIPVLDLHKPESYPQLQNCIQRLINDDVRIILLGCAGLSTLSNRMKSDYPYVKFVDSVKVGIRLLIAYIQVGDI